MPDVCEFEKVYGVCYICVAAVRPIDRNTRGSRLSTRRAFSTYDLPDTAQNTLNHIDCLCSMVRLRGCCPCPCANSTFSLFWWCESNTRSVVRLCYLNFSSQINSCEKGTFVKFIWKTFIHMTFYSHSIQLAFRWVCHNLVPFVIRAPTPNIQLLANNCMCFFFIVAKNECDDFGDVRLWIVKIL